MSSLVSFLSTYTATMRHQLLYFSFRTKWRKKGSLKYKQIIYQFQKEVWQSPGVPWFNQHLLSCVILLLNGVWIFPEINHQSWDSLCKEASFLVWVNCAEWSDNSSRPSGYVWTATQSYHLGNTKDFTSLPWGPLLLIVATRSACRPS